MCNPLKSNFFLLTINFLGHQVSKSGITSIVHNTAKLSNFATLMDKTALKSFLGLLNYYRQFLQGLASFVKPLTDMTSPNIPFSCSD